VNIGFDITETGPQNINRLILEMVMLCFLGGRDVI
jgi:hypothetical protein